MKPEIGARGAEFPSDDLTHAHQTREAKKNRNQELLPLHAQ